MLVDYERQVSVDGQQEHAPSCQKQHAEVLWVHCVNLVLGAWLLSAPATLGYLNPALMWSDVLSGVLILLFAGLSLSPRNLWAPWAVSAVGLWLLFAPLVFWAPTAAAYANDTLVGALVIAFAVGIPPAPGINPVARVTGPDAPPGRDFSPSGWTNRLPIIILAFVGLFISRYL